MCYYPPCFISLYIFSGCLVEPLVLPELQEAFELWSAVMASADQPPYRDLLGRPGMQV